PGVETEPKESLIESMEARWQQELRTARRRIENDGIATLADELHNGIVKWFECLIAEGSTAPRPQAARNVILGNHPTYGQVTQYEGRDARVVGRLGVGLLLGTGKGMPRDLETKLQTTALEPHPFELLILIWPRDTVLSAPYDQHFSEASRIIWERFDKTKAT